MACPRSSIDPACLPHVWRVDDLAPEKATIPTGHPRLDQVLPGGGWPRGAMVELLQERAGQHVWQLLLPALVNVLQERAGPLVLVGAPLLPFLPSLHAQNLPVQRLLCIHCEKGSSRLWAAEQALRCPEVAAVLAWLPEAKADALRRLHLAAGQHSPLFFVFSRSANRDHASPASLRLLVQGSERCELQVLKRRGPPVLQPVSIPAVSPRLAALLEARRKPRRSRPLSSEALDTGRSHVLDRTAAWA